MKLLLNFLLVFIFCGSNYGQNKSTITGTITDAKTGKPLYATIMIEPIQSPDSVRIIANDGKSGSYSFSLMKNYVYNIEVKVPGYFPSQKVVTMDKSEVVLNVLMKSVAQEDVLDVPNLEFEINSSKIISGEESLDQVAEYMMANPNVKIMLEGHTEAGGTESHMMKLSKQRIEAVRNYLITKGVSGKRITLKPMGGTSPLNAGQTEEERKLNRRVEFKITQR